MKRLSPQKIATGHKLIKRYIAHQRYALKLLQNDPKLKPKKLTGYLNAGSTYDEVSNNKAWIRVFLGRSVSLFNEKKQHHIAFDFGSHGEIGLFNIDWLCNYVKNEIFRESLTKEYEFFTIHEHWTHIFDHLIKKKLIKKKLDDPLYYTLKNFRH